MWQGRSWAEVARGWEREPDFRDAYIRALAEQPFSALAWETAPSSSATCDRSFEHAIIESPTLARMSPNPVPFQRYFADASEGICTFTNLGRDALLIVPAPMATNETYTHLAAFLRGAPSEQTHALWRALGRAVQSHWQTSTEPVWVSTAGLGVHWLHVRLDQRPKYYRHAPFVPWG